MLRLRLHDNAGGENATKSFRIHGSSVRGAKRKSCTPKRKKTKTLAKVEEFENGNVLPDKFGCVNSRNGVLASFSVTFVSFSAVYTDPTIQKIVFTIFVM